MPSAPTPDTADVPAVERVIELVLFGPLDVGACVVDRVPAVVDRVPAVVDRVRRELVLARIVGKMAVDGGAREVRRRVRQAAAPGSGDDVDDGSPDVSRTGSVPAPAAPELLTDHPGDRPTGPTADDAADVPDVGELALPDYDHLPAAHVVGKLAGLSEAERDLVERYERAHRHRRTVLGKLDQLRDRSS